MVYQAIILLHFEGEDPVILVHPAGLALMYTTKKDDTLFVGFWILEDGKRECFIIFHNVLKYYAITLLQFELVNPVDLVHPSSSHEKNNTQQKEDDALVSHDSFLRIFSC